MKVSSEFFTALEVQPVLGPSFVPDEHRLGAAPAALVSYSYWQRYLGGTSDFANRTLRIGGSVFSIVGAGMSIEEDWKQQSSLECVGSDKKERNNRVPVRDGVWPPSGLDSSGKRENGTKTMAGIRVSKPSGGNALRRALLLILITALAACSDGTPTPRGAIQSPPPTPSGNTAFFSNFAQTAAYPPGPSSGAGLRVGVLKRAEQVVSRADCLVAETGELACLFYDPSSYSSVYLLPYETRVPILFGAAHGTLRVDTPTRIAGSGTLYAAPKNTLADGSSVVADFTIMGGSLTDQNRVLELTISSLGDVTTLSLSGLNGYYYGGSSLLALSGLYPIFDFFGDRGSMSIAADGALFSQATSGCVIGGQVAVIDPLLNLYAVSVSASNCSRLNGAYEGFASVVEMTFDNGITRLRLAVFNDATFIAGDVIGW